MLQGENPKKLSPRLRNFLQQLFSTFRLLVQRSGWFALAGLVVTIGLFLLFTKLTEDVFSNEFASLDKSILLGVHDLANPGLDGFFIGLTTLGSTIPIAIITVIICGILLWRRYFYYAILSVVIIGGGELIYLGLKQIFQRARPTLFLGPIASPGSFSYPSGHATMAVCVYGTIAFLTLVLLKNRLARAIIGVLCLVMILLIGLSRVYLGAHYPTDVLAGYFAGGCWVGVIITGHQILKHRGKSPDES